MPASQPTQPIRFLDYPDESDLDGGTSPTGLYPIPANLPVESWPVGTGSLTLAQWQQDSTNIGGDRHAIIVKPGAGYIWETWQAKLAVSAWQASNGAKFSLILNSVPISGFEIVQSTGATDGPRAPGAPTANAGADQWVPAGSVARLQGSVTGTSPLTVGWKLYSGPAPVVFGDATQAGTTATFAIPGTYTLMLSAADGTHAVAYDAVVIQVTLTPTAARSGMDEVIGFATAAGHHYRVEHSDNLADWLTLADNIPGTGATLQITHVGAYAVPRHFYRVVVLD